MRPPWVAPLPGLIDVVIDPGMAFGTGQHGTTRACLELLLDVPPGSLLDAGCGSGVLAIASRKLGHDPVSAVDTDPLAVEAARRNARDNAVTVDIALGDGGSPPPAVDTIVANIACRQVAALGARLGAPPRHAILSGLRPGEAREATAPWRRIGLTDVRTIESDGWTTVAMTRG